jgi:hypothetical protein
LKCKHAKSQIRSNFSRTCNICNHTETASSNTLFHEVMFGLRNAFLFLLKCLQPLKNYSSQLYGSSTRDYRKNSPINNGWVREAIKSSENRPLDTNVSIDEFVICRKEKRQRRNEFLQKEEKKQNRSSINWQRKSQMNDQRKLTKLKLYAAPDFKKIIKQQ